MFVSQGKCEYCSFYPMGNVRIISHMGNVQMNEDLRFMACFMSCTFSIYVFIYTYCSCTIAIYRSMYFIPRCVCPCYRYSPYQPHYQCRSYQSGKSEVSRYFLVKYKSSTNIHSCTLACSIGFPRRIVCLFLGVGRGTLVVMH